MTVPTMRSLVPKDLITPLKILGKYEWLKWTPKDTIPPSSTISVNLPDDPALYQHKRFMLFLSQQFDSLMLYRLFALSKTLAFGPKILCPTHQQCEALQHVDVNVRHDEYEQPFSSIIVQLPASFRQSMTEAFEWNCPKFVLLFHHKRSGYLFSFSCGNSDRLETVNIMSPRSQFETIEDSIRYSYEQDGNDLRQGAQLQRIACNFGLLLTNFGVRDCGPIDPKSHRTQSKRAKSRNHRKADRAQSLLDASMNRIEFQQDVVFFDDARDSSESGESTNAKVRTHWRRGHFRRQRHGFGRAKRKLIFIKPCLVNSTRFQGDLADTEYRISGGQAASAAVASRRRIKIEEPLSPRSVVPQGVAHE